MDQQDVLELKQRIHAFSKPKKNCWILDSNQIDDPHGKYELVLGYDIHDELRVDLWNDETPEKIETFLKANQGFKLLSLNYNLKQALHDIDNQNEEVFNWPLFYSFIPQTLIRITRKYELEILSHTDDPNIIYQEILATKIERPIRPKIDWKEYPSFPDYQKKISTIKDYLLDGKIYEVNYCHVFEASLPPDSDPKALYYYWNDKIRKPFSAYAELDYRSLLCFSPERYLSKRGKNILTQPIKGTLDITQGEITEKEFAENVMIVDLCRNDLARICETGSVEVLELMGSYGFTNIRHLISTIQGSLKKEIGFMEILEASFPMGSMTGAPKYSAMKVIEELESFNRSIFSGSIGYYDENHDFDLNVVIRSMLVDQEKRSAQLPVGGAIVFDSNTKEEYQETLNKIKFFLS